MARYHRRSIRLKGYDYTQPGAYFVTICTHGRAPWFGRVVDGDMVLNAFGQIVPEEWFRTGQVRPYVEWFEDEFVVMPNHIRGIVWIVEWEHIIRNAVRANGRSLLHAILRYIAEAPLRWHLDRYHPDAIGSRPATFGVRCAPRSTALQRHPMTLPQPIRAARKPP